MNHQLPSVNYPAIKQLLVSRLQAALELSIWDCSVLKQLKSQRLYLAQQQQRVLYVCAIALELSQALNLSALEIANTLAQLVCRQFESTGTTHKPDFIIQVVPPGWLHFELTELYQAAWLQNLLLSPPILQMPQTQNPQLSKSDASGLFAVQYAHARCCSLVQLAHREGLITLGQASDTSSALWVVVKPNPIPWLHFEQKLRLSHPAERALIAQLLGLVDDIYCPSSRQRINWLKAGLNLSQAFQSFYSNCRIWGEVKSQNIQLAQARLGLLLITQSALRLLLQDRLGIIAPSEL